MLIGAPESSGPDKVARDFAACFRAHLGTIEIDPRNLPGDAGRVMLTALGEAPPAGATFGWVSTLTIHQFEACLLTI